MKNNAKKQTIPPRLMPGDRIGVVAPASPFEVDKFNRGINVLESMGFFITIAEGLFKKKGYLAGSDKHRAGLVNNFFADRGIKAIICARGGFGSLRILPLLDYSSIRNNPKIFVGFSDITALLSSLYTKCGLVSYHGPMVTTLGDADENTVDALFFALSSGKDIKIEPEGGITIKSGSVTGKVVGGNLTTLCHLIGTPFEPDFRGHILFIEESGESVYRVDRMLMQMKLAGFFKELRGLIIGSFEKCGCLNEIYNVVEDIFKEYNIPVLAGFAIGHGKKNITIPIGICATLDADRKILSFHEPAVL